MKKRYDKERLRNFLIISILGLVFINFSFVSAYLILIKFGTLTLSPGEKYTLNIPFVGPSKAPVICGKTQQTDGTLLSGINISIFLNKTGSLVGSNLSGGDGKFCITLPEINSNTKYEVYVKYDNETLALGSNDYQLSFRNNQVYNKSIDNYVILNGNITNQDAPVENGRFEINLKYYDNGSWVEIFDYQKYSLNIEPNQIYNVPNSELNVSWSINADTLTGRYKFYIKTSFNAKEKTLNIYFNITE